MENTTAQGTIEYLVILAVVVVIGLVVVSLLGATADTQNLAATTERIDTQTRSGIVITEAAADLSGDSLLLLRNNDPEEKTLTKITIDGKENVFDQRIARGQEILIKLEQLETNCKCEAGETTKTCTYQIEFTSRYGITTTQTQTTTITCEQNITPATNPSIPTYIFSTTNCFDITQDPIPICTLDDLNKIRDDRTKNYILINDIDASPTKQWNYNGSNYQGWLQIGTNTNTFTGVFEGNNKTILNLYIFRPNTRFVGLFTSNANQIKNLNLVDANITARSEVGGIAGRNANTGKIINLTVTGNIKANDGMGGGIIGDNYGDINSSKNYANVSSNNNLFGSTGGIVGRNANPGIIYDVKNYGTVFSDNGSVGGIAGFNSSGSPGAKIILASNYGNITSNSVSAGGIASGNASSIQQSFNMGNINGNNYVGGITSNSIYGGITNSYNLGNINGNEYVGGITGNSDNAVLARNYNNGIVNGNEYVGGIAGRIGTWGSLSYSFNLGSVISEGNNIGGLIGVNSMFTPSPTVSFWDQNLSGQEYCYGTNYCNNNYTQNNNSYYYSEANSPMSSWNFETIWQENSNSLPTLR